MTVFRRIWRNFHLYVLWALAAALFWAWIFGFVTDAPREKKLTVFIDAPCRDRELRLMLEQELPEGIKMIQVHPFDYVMFGSEELLNADLYLVPRSRSEQFVDSFLPLGEESEGCWRYGGTAYGLPVYDAESGSGALRDYVSYEDEDYYLFFGVHSLHTLGAEAAADNTAAELAARLLTIP